MFGIGFFEILVIAILGLLIFGPEKLPEAIRSFAFGFSKAKRTWQATRKELEQELGMNDIRREIHNAQIMENIESLNRDIEKPLDPVEAERADDVEQTTDNTTAVNTDKS